MTTDLELLRHYTRDKSEESFAALVNRHLNLVYSAALRQVRSPQLAEEVAQSVFIELGCKARLLAPDSILTAWLYQVTRRTAIDVVRREARRQLREQIALEMNTTNAAAADWSHIETLLDEAMQGLDDNDRAAVLLRYFENKSLREVGQTLGTNEDAAQKRVSRAVERLREFFTKRGFTVGASALVGMISANAVQAAPEGLAITISTVAALSALSIPASVGAGATTGFLGTLLQVSRTRLVAGFAATAIIGVATYLLLSSPQRADQFVIADSTTPNVELNQQAASLAPQDVNAAVEDRQPDALSLLLAVAQARQRIGSGSIELQLSTDRFEGGRKETHKRRLATMFDGSRLRFESFAREYAYTVSGDDESAEGKELVRRADTMDKESAVRAGLMKGSEAHVITASDGATLVRFCESDGAGGSTIIDEPEAGSAKSAEYFFDPRCLGLRPSLSFGSTIEACLGYKEAKSINLAGRELVEGVPAWHVHVLSKYDESLDFWIDVAQPTRVLKQAKGNDIVISRYDDARSQDPIPVEVSTMTSHQNGLSFGAKFIRSNMQLDVPPDPVAFTLAGLGMPVGTPISDIRIHRSIGYWNGTGLSESPPPKRAAESTSHPNISELLDLLERSPASPEALEAATWILLNTPDGPEVEKAADVILREHTRDTNLVFLCTELERLRHRCSKPLLEAMLKDNTNPDVRGTACFSLGMLLKDEAKYGQDRNATAEAEKHLERVIKDFGQVKQRGFKLEYLARPELSELRRLTIGKPAPEIEGEDLDGQAIKLSDYRGKVVVLTFWWPGYIEAPEHRKLVERMTGQPFAFIGVYGDDDLTKAKAEVEKYGITWPSFWDKREGPISRNWNVRYWPNLWVLDRQGIIRYRGVRGPELYEAVDTLLRE